VSHDSPSTSDKASLVLRNLHAQLDLGAPARVVVLGDSIARGDEASVPSSSFVSLWADSLHKEFGSPILVTNMSQGGNTARDVIRLLRLTRGLPLYDLMIVAVGINDATLRQRGGPNVSPRSFSRSIGQIVRKARRATVDVLLVSPCIPSPKLPTAPIEDYRLALERHSVENACAFADVTSAWRERGGDHLLRNQLNHPDDAGHRLYADVLLRTVARASTPGTAE
jgi:lysophospholipase L1-like esterase